MDEIAALKQFRLEDAATEGAREYAARAVAAAGRRSRVRRRYVVAVALVGAAALSTAAYAVVRELVIGDPAPAEVTQQLVRFGQHADLIPYQRPEAPETRGLRVVAVLDSSFGRTYLFGDTAGRCAHTWIEGDRGDQGRLNMSSVCGNARETFWAYGRQPFDGQEVGLLSGRVGDDVTRVATRVAGRELTVPLTERWFLAEFAQDPTALLTYDATGRLVKEYSVGRGPITTKTVQAPHEAEPAREVATIAARDGRETVTLEVARASDGGYCMIVRSPKTPTNRGCSVPAPRAREIGVTPMQFGGAPDGIQLLVGPVGADVARLQVRYQDGRLAEIPLSDGWALYEVEPRDYVVGRRPAELIARDRAGAVVTSERLPWVR